MHPAPVDEASTTPRMLDGIRGVVLGVQAWRGTTKRDRNKPDAARLAAADALEGRGRRAAIARWMRHA
ncbi:hypothetical protein [Stakelama saccharophila]|uniref:Uncharacterized protein n=1 Tax=Stakelama saccharophila TaxID=3075605 RepID=A0ABZ0BB83_9SPHN|nr:hypothetical protein [Stakelama sp. W311]WNO54544.1 hypothetical protein RPR59_04625 [Stakelama sp. W311]